MKMPCWVFWVLALAGVSGRMMAQSILDQAQLLYSTSASPKHGVNWGAQPPATVPTVSGAHPRQFEGALMYGGVTRQGIKGATVSGSFSANVAAINWPRSTVSGSVSTILRAAVGQPYLSHGYDAQFGAEISPPLTDINGAQLGSTNSGYWYPEPVSIITSTNGVKSFDTTHSRESYYWSPHAAKAYATKNGQIQVIWRTSTSTLTALPAGGTNWVTHVQIPPFYYPIKSVSMLISVVPVKEPQIMLWTKGDYQKSGRAVKVPSGVRQVNFIYNSNVPKTVSQSEVIPGQGVDGLEQLNTGTIEVNSGFIQAYNREGRVFMELLGEATSPTTKRQLGYEIVDIAREMVPKDVKIELGERVTPNYINDEVDANLSPVPIIGVAGRTYAYQHQPDPNGISLLYATRITEQLTDYQVLWTREGVGGLAWPRHFVRYTFVWPTDISKYNHYVRSLVANDIEASQTSITLPSENNPVLEFQDDSNLTKPRAVLTENSRFYTYLDETQPALRALIRYNTGNRVAFERVFSWLDKNLIEDNFTDPISNGLDNIKAHTDYPTITYPSLLADYNAYTTNRARGVNGIWKLYVSDDTIESATGTRSLYKVAASSDGRYAVVATSENLFVSSDFGTNWFARMPIRTWTSVAVSSSGQKMIATASGSSSYRGIFVSEDYGVTWNAKETSAQYYGCACSSDGQNMVASRNGGIVLSTDGGKTWILRGNATTFYLLGISNDGQKIIAAPSPSSGGYLYISSDAGLTFTSKLSNFNWTSVSCSTNGTYMVASASGGSSGRNIYTSSDSGSTWTARDSARQWKSVSISQDGKYLAACVSSTGAYVYKSSDYGTNWTSVGSAGIWNGVVVASGSSGSTIMAIPSGYDGIVRTADGGSTWSSSYLGASSVGSWRIELDTIDPVSLIRATFAFTNSTKIMVAANSNNATTYPSQIVVSGITNKVLAVRLGLDEVNFSRNQDMDLILVAPTARYCTVLSDTGPIGQPMMGSSVNIDDAAPNLAPPSTSFFLETSYRPTDIDPNESAPSTNLLSKVTTLQSLLDPVVPDKLPPPLHIEAFPDLSVSPKVVEAVAYVGERIGAPAGELGASSSYFPGYINPAKGVSFNPSAYKDPFAVGFQVAATGAIIPVNALPDAQPLEVWWFRRSLSTNLRMDSLGFAPTYWPSVIARYTPVFPDSTRPRYRQIVLASNEGSGPLSGPELGGSLYIGNTLRDAVGYNPNEEHALLQGGRVWALRDDLNIVEGDDFSSKPYVLLDYMDVDGRPSMSVFEVVRETDTAKFNYTVKAGTILQPPMPLPLLDKPIPPADPGNLPRSINAEIACRDVVAVGFATDATLTSTITVTDWPLFVPYQTLLLQRKAGGTPYYFVPKLINASLKSLDGVLSPTAPIPLTFDAGIAPATNTYLFTYLVESGSVAVAQVGQRAWIASVDAQRCWEVTIQSVSNVSNGTRVVLNFGSSYNAQADGDVPGASFLVVSPLIQSTASSITPNPKNPDWVLGYELLSDSLAGFDEEEVSRSRFYNQTTFQDRKGSLWIYRGPHNATDPATRRIQFYYKTLPGFWFPAEVTQPVVGTITTYLREPQTIGTGWVGSSIVEEGATSGDALGITYKAVWPETAPVLQMAETLTIPKRGLPAVRGQTSLELLYQQSINSDRTRPSVVLHDPTVAKKYPLADTAPDGSATALNKIPSSIQTSIYRGNTYFPQLPPHLSERFFLDPNDSKNGSLVLKGVFKQEVLGESYLQANVLGSFDIAAIKSLCDPADELKAFWDAAIDDAGSGGLTTALETFYPNPAKPGTFTSTIDVGGQMVQQARLFHAGDLVEVKHSDSAVDSYALTAIGPGTGYVTLVSGQGSAFTPNAEPVSVKVIKVVETLYRGEAKVILSSNPLAEKVTVQQIVDVASKTDDYEYEWWIAAPVDGSPPATYQSTAVNILNSDSSATWNHLRFPSASDSAGNLGMVVVTDDRWVPDVHTTVIPVDTLPFASVTSDATRLSFMVQKSLANQIRAGSLVTVSDRSGKTALGVVVEVSQSESNAEASLISVAANTTTPLPAAGDVYGLYEGSLSGRPQSLVYRDFTVSSSDVYSQYYLSLRIDDAMGAKVFVDGELAVVVNMGDEDTSPVVKPTGFSPEPLDRVYSLPPQRFAGGRTANGTVSHRVSVELYSQAHPGTRLPFQCQLDAYKSEDRVDVDGSQWIKLDVSRYPDKIRTTLGESADVRALSDNYLVCRYRATDSSHPSYRPDVAGRHQGWSQWTDPALVEGWIKRVLAGINPFNQRTTDLFNNTVNTDANILTSAGKRWEGDVALNLDSINDYGLIEIYETILRRGKDLSINAGISYDPANDALMLAAGYLSDLYMMVGNEARSDAANPTIGIGSKDQTYGDVATALFSFKGQLSSLLEEELALLRGRDDFLQPGVRLAPVYNRLVWNYTRGIDSGEVIYALNYNILDQNMDGKVDAQDAAKLYPQGHGDAYGHYLTALKGYYSLLIDQSFTWVPRIEAVNILGKAVAVDYQDERKFASAAAAVVRTGKEVFDLTWRRDYVPGRDAGWSHFVATRNNTSMAPPTTRCWGMDHWAARTGQAAYLHWAVGNSILPATDPNPGHEGIQKVDRTTVPELQELAMTGAEMQTSMDNAEGLMTPLGMADGSLAFDLNPNQVMGPDPRSHFEQIHDRALAALSNAVASFDDAKDVTRLMRSEQDSLADLQNAIEKQELAYTSSLIELYGTPYPDDVGPGKLYKQGYEGPDLYHFNYVETLGIEAPGVYQANEPDYVAKVDIQQLAANWSVPGSILGTDVITDGPVDGSLDDLVIVNLASDKYLEVDPTTGKPVYYIEYPLGSHGFFDKPKAWTSKRKSPGKIQQAISELIAAHDRFQYALAAQCESDKQDLDKSVLLFKAQLDTFNQMHAAEETIRSISNDIGQRQADYDRASKYLLNAVDQIRDLRAMALAEVPENMVFGFAFGPGTVASSIATPIIYGLTAPATIALQTVEAEWQTRAARASLSDADEIIRQQNLINDLDRKQQLRAAIVDLGNQLKAVQGDFQVINEKERLFDDSKRNYAALVAQGERLQQEREVFRKRSAALVQGYRTRDAAFRVFRNEKLERYKTLFDLASRYAYLAANAYDYDTGLLNTTKGRAFLSRIINSRALGVVKGGVPQFAGSNSGDPGLSSVLAEMKADWEVLKSRLGFNNPTAYGTTFSLRTEKHRILPSAEGANAWKDVLNQSLRANILEDFDVKRYCMQVGADSEIPMPGLVVEFETTIADGLNFFGQPLQGWDHSFDSSSFATKVFSAGVALEGYIGMDNPVANTGVVGGVGATSPGDPDAAFNDPMALAANPGVYLIPVGLDSMRSPALGDQGNIRTWSVDDVAIPLPFNIGGSDFSNKPVYQSSDSLSEPIFAIRKHASFRPVSTTAAFTSSIFGSGGGLQRSQFTNTRLIGRSVWNSKWKLVIPGIKLFHDPDEGLRRFIDSVKDIKIHLVTYSYSGN